MPNGRRAIIAYKRTVETTKTQYGLRDRNDRIWLRKRVCERAGLIVHEQTSQHLRFGWRAYLVEIPDHLPKRRAVRLALKLRRRIKLLRLGHLANGLLAHAGSNPFLSDHTLGRFAKSRGS